MCTLDDHSLKLHFIRTWYFNVVGLHEILLKDNSTEAVRLRSFYAPSCLKPDEAKVPNIACVHAVATTSDNMLIVGLRRRNLDYHGHKWSVSFEEQVWEEDQQEPNDKDLPFNAAARGANEEFLGRGSKIVLKENVRLLSLFLEYSILNLTYCAHVEIPLSFQDLVHRWRDAHADPEFEDLQPVSCDLEPLAGMLLSERCPLGLDGPGGGAWHPTSRYRLLKFMLYKWGYDNVVASALRGYPTAGGPLLRRWK